ncbi:hypothetical protein ACLQ2R_16140 [Streptosporangium sp. DT93]|uniref:hypothetical protein n=1 Tax=Streptosporangium sp. DT93 TaxID=3393428 RepID=UPI003CF00B50
MVRGRVCVLGDAAWCVTPLGGGGSSLALAGGYVLAAYLSTGGDDVEGALRDHEAWMRPLVEKTQKLPPGVPRIAYPESMFGVRVQRAGTAVAGSPLVRRFAARVMGGVATTERALPRFAEPHGTTGPGPVTPPTPA